MIFKKINTTPTLRTLPNGKVVSFYSPAQLEELIPVNKRMPQSFGNNLTEGHEINMESRSTGKVYSKWKPSLQ